MVSVKAVLDILACAIGLLGVAPLFLNLDLAAHLLFPIALTAAFFMERKWVRPLRGLLPTVLSGAFFIFYALQFSRTNLAGPAINILVILLSVRLVSERLPRNYLQIYALSLFSLAASSLFNLSAAFLIYLALLLLCVAVSLVLLTFLSDNSRASLTFGGLKRVVTVAASMPAASVPLVLVFFIIIPRAQFPFWNMHSSTGDKVTGFSDRVEPGSSSQVREVKTPVLRAQGEKLRTGNLYWRGIVLNTPREKAWLRTEVTEQDFVRYRGGATVKQTVFPEPSANPYLLVLDLPGSISGIQTLQAHDLVFSRRRGSTGRISYDSLSIMNDTIAVKGGIDRDFYLLLPDPVSPRVLAIGKRIAERGGTDRERLSLVEDYFISSGYRYTTRNLPQSGDPIDEFLFEKKAGNCVFFASSFATLLRTAGVPSRLVVGYYGGEYNELGGYYLVTEDMAHVWVEVYQEGKGWVRRDPSVFAVNFAGERGAVGAGFSNRLRMFIDSLDYYWNLAVINYDLEKQIRIFRSADSMFRNISMPLGKTGLSLVLCAAGLAAAVWYLVGKWRKSSREQRILRSFLNRVARKSLHGPVSPSTGLHELADRTGDPDIRRFAEIYCGAIYRDRQLSDKEITILRGIVKGI
jgi:transglutaminase-like putative cysteine protease